MKNSPKPRKKQKVTAMLWYSQGDAATKAGAEVVDGGGAPKLDDARKTKHKGTKGKRRNDPSVLFMRQGTGLRCENQGTVGLEMKLSP